MGKEELKQKCLNCIEAHKDTIIQLGEDTYRTPELGYKEFGTTKRVENAFEDIGLSPQSNIAYTGCKAVIGQPNTGPCIAVMGELDSVACQEHPDSDGKGNVHACGHHAQLANMLGCAIGMHTSGVMEQLKGSVEFVAIPAEECVDFEYRQGLMNQGEIKFLGGKQEYLYRGGFDQVDIVMQNHVMPLEDGKRCVVDTKGNGFISKTVRFIGRSSHAGFEPDKGINALNMAELAMNNIHAIRETFRDEDKVRVSMVITEGGGLVNVVPSLVVMQVMVRAFTVKAMLEASEKVNRAFKAAAMALAGQVEIQESIGYLPLQTNEALSQVYKENLMTYEGAKESEFVPLLETAGSTDLGDISRIKPCMHIWSRGVEGGLHTKDYQVKDAYETYVVPAKHMALSIIDMLYEDGARAKEIICQYQPEFTKETYLTLMEEHSKVDFFDGSII